mmetsp:Transcript_43105/g.93899  ORF Transcript_43105/g.93899 Transcript_43105/m.93899 type:complete len:272 (-) Transcript_43105:133-948(-)|eukprot:CAMPEP_0170596432 /NCGR_PEP_ID=MMETSP0224-20130122/15115_1 /TAXON_ID=285029 /ORGANISM="Togula jolla, Strain CCCM 725" /LENGTH=271 /DNA_ID=CAMNT_0010920725 /DNA_START=51 /DNA_END=866 /DNA_ORIENTATION=+
MSFPYAVSFDAMVGMLLPSELAQLVAASSSATEWFSQDVLWKQCIEHKSVARASAKLYGPNHRQALMECMGALQHATLANNTELFLETREEVDLLLEALQTSRRTATAHMQSGVRVARTLVGYFNVAQAAAGSAETPPTAFSLGIKGPGGRKGELNISMALQDNPETQGSGLTISATHSRAAALKRIGGSRFVEASIAIDVCLAGSHHAVGTLMGNSTQIVVNGIPKNVRSDTMASVSEVSLGQGKSRGTLCVLCIREAETPSEFGVTRSL